MLFFLQNVVAVSATLLTAPLAARSHVCVLFGHSHTLPAIRMDSPLDLESPPNDEWPFKSASSFPTRLRRRRDGRSPTSMCTIESHETVPYAIASV